MNTKSIEPEYIEDLIHPIVEDEEERLGKITQRPHNELWDIHRKNGRVTWGDVYAHILAKPNLYYAKDEVDPEVWEIFNRDPNTEMICIVENDGEEFWIPEFDDGSAKAKEEEEMIRKANDPKITVSIIIGILVFIAFVFWITFQLNT